MAKMVLVNRLIKLKYLLFQNQKRILDSISFNVCNYRICMGSTFANQWKEKTLSSRLSLLKTSYKEFENDLFKVLSEDKDTFALSKFTYGLKKSGLKQNDQRLRYVYKKIEKFKLQQNASSEEMVRINFNEMKELLADNIVLIRHAFISNMIMPNFSDFCVRVDDLYWACRKNLNGKITSHSKVLSRQKLESWAVSFCTIDGQRHSAGDYTTPVILHTCCTPINYAFAVNQHGANVVNQYVSNEPVVRNSEMEKVLYLTQSNIPQNPLDVAGALIVSSLLNFSQNSEQTFQGLMEKYKKLCGGISPNISWNKSFHIHEAGAEMGVRAYAHHLKNNLCFPNGTDLDQTVDLLFKFHSVEMTPESLAVLAATLANDGVCPITGERIFSSEAVQSTFSIMLSCGISSGFAFKVGIPAVAGISGGILLVYPGLMGAFTWSPPLNENGISVRGVQFFERLSEIFDLHYFSYRPLKDYTSQLTFDLDGSDENEQLTIRDPLKDPYNPTPAHLIAGFPGSTKFENRSSKTVQAIFAASLGDLHALRTLFLRGHNMGDTDYDGRTPLHLAASQGRLSVVKFLVEKCKVEVDVKDRWNLSPIDNAKSALKTDVVKYLENYLKSKSSPPPSPSVHSGPQSTKSSSTST